MLKFTPMHINEFLLLAGISTGIFFTAEGTKLLFKPRRRPSAIIDT
jgi:hypothetical protein